MRARSVPVSVVSVIVIICMTFAVASCAEEVRSQPALTSPQGEASFVTAASLDELVARSTLIVIGNVSGAGGTVNMARDIHDVTKPDPLLFEVGQVYHVTVSRYIKGSGAPALDVLQAEGLVNGQREGVNAESIKRARARFPYIPLGSGSTYLMFLVRAQGFPDNQYFVGDIAPWRFTLPAEGMAKAESPWLEAQVVFPPMPPEQLIRTVETLVVARGSG